MAVSGVGTQMRIASTFANSVKSGRWRREAARLRHLADALGAEMLDVGLALGQRLDLGGVDVEAGGLDPALPEHMGERQADIAETDDADAQGAGFEAGLEFGSGLDGDTNVHGGDSARVGWGGTDDAKPGPRRWRSKTEQRVGNRPATEPG